MAGYEYHPLLSVGLVNYSRKAVAKSIAGNHNPLSNKRCSVCTWIAG
jgi:hypothetical protein